MTFSNIQVADGWLDINLIPMIKAPCIAAIVTQSNNFSKKINCGGGTYQDYAADWPAAKTKPRHLYAYDFYRDWAAQSFGERTADAVADIFAVLDGQLPRPAEWKGGPGGVEPNETPWKEVQKKYAFVKQFQKLRSQVQGQGNRERFDYWLNTFQYLKAVARVACASGQYAKSVKVVESENNTEAKTRLARKTLIPIRKEMLKAVQEVYRYLLPTVGTPGELGTVANWEQHNIPSLLTYPGKELERILGKKLPEKLELPMKYKGSPRLIVPTVRTNWAAGEKQDLNVIVLDNKPPRSAMLYWREMGSGEFAAIPLHFIARGTYQVRLPQPAKRDAALEYYLRVQAANGKTLFFPPTAPRINQTVVAVPKK